MNILITGGSGFIGSALMRSLLADGHQVWALTRNPSAAKTAAGAQALAWDGRTPAGWLETFSKMDAVVNLAGQTVGQWPWTAERKRRIRASRVQAGQAILEAYRQASRKPGVLIQASGIGYYGPCGSEPVDEASPSGADFFSGVASDWEASSAPVEALGVRRAVIRTSLVLDSKLGALPMMALPVKLFAGGPLGNGKQGVSWIHIADHVAAMRFLLENERGSGVFNLTAPEPLSNADFMRALARALGRPYWLRAPAFALKLVLGEMSTLLLDGQFALPRHLLDLGFKFRFASAGDALNDLFV